MGEDIINFIKELGQLALLITAISVVSFIYCSAKYEKICDRRVEAISESVPVKAKSDHTAPYRGEIVVSVDNSSLHVGDFVILEVTEPGNEMPVTFELPKSSKDSLGREFDLFYDYRWAHFNHLSGFPLSVQKSKDTNPNRVTVDVHKELEKRKYVFGTEYDVLGLPRETTQDRYELFWHAPKMLHGKIAIFEELKVWFERADDTDWNLDMVEALGIKVRRENGLELYFNNANEFMIAYKKREEEKKSDTKDNLPRLGVTVTRNKEAGLITITPLTSVWSIDQFFVYLSWPKPKTTGKKRQLTDTMSVGAKHNDAHLYVQPVF